MPKKTRKGEPFARNIANSAIAPADVMPKEWLPRRGELFCREWSINFFFHIVFTIEEVSAGRCDAEKMDSEG